MARVTGPADPNAADRAMAALADRQQGVFASWQLPDEVCDRFRLFRRTHAARLRVLHHGVYAYGHRRLTPNGHRLAAVLAYGPTAVVSHRSAAMIWGLIETGPTRVEVTVPGTSRRSRKGIRVHRTRRLEPEDITALDGVPLTTVTRTLFDLAGELDRRWLRRAIEQADRTGLLDLAGLARTIHGMPARKGSARLRLILADYTAPAFTRSELERRFLELVRSARLPTPQVNVKVAGLEVDVFWPQWRLVVELDGRGYHSAPHSFENDRLRDARLQRARCRVLRITARRIGTSPQAVIADVRALAALAA